PQPERVRRVIAVAENRRVVRHALHDLARHPAHVRSAGGVLVALRMAAELDLDGPLGPRDLPRIAESQPFVGLLDLPAVDDVLMKNPELVADAVGERRYLERRERVDEARRETAQSAVTQARLRLLGEQRLEIEAELLDRGAHRVVKAEIDEVVTEMRT